VETDDEYNDIGKKEKFGVYFDDELIDVVEAEDLEEAEFISHKKIKTIPLKLIYKGKILLEDDNLSDYAEDELYGRLYVKPLND